MVDGVYRSGLIFRDSATVDEVNQYLNQWRERQYDSHPFGILSFHGAPGRILLMGKKTMTLEEIGTILEGKCKGRVLHFDSCAVMDVPPSEMRDFRFKTKAAAVCGFTENVDWLDSAAFTLTLLNALLHADRPSEALRDMYAQHKGAALDLGFRAVWARGQVGIPGRRK